MDTILIVRPKRLLCAWPAADDAGPVATGGWARDGVVPASPTASAAVQRHDRDCWRRESPTLPPTPYPHLLTELVAERCSCG